MDNLLVRTVLGFAFLMVIMALALFIPAGSLSFWQGWLYLADFALCTILITAYLIKNDRQLLEGRVMAAPVVETRKPLPDDSRPYPSDCSRLGQNHCQ